MYKIYNVFHPYIPLWICSVYCVWKPFIAFQNINFFRMILIHDIKYIDVYWNHSGFNSWCSSFLFCVSRSTRLRDDSAVIKYKLNEWWCLLCNFQYLAWAFHWIWSVNVNTNANAIPFSPFYNGRWLSICTNSQIKYPIIVHFFFVW